MTTALALDRLLRCSRWRPPRMFPCHDCFVDTLDTHRRAVVVPLGRGQGDRQSVRGDAQPALRVGAVVRHGVWSFARHPLARALSVIYPMLTLLAIVVTANHYWLDAAGGAIIFLAASQILRMFRIRSSRKTQALVQ